MKLRVFNVGQADSLELIPSHNCKFQGKSILVDCGWGNKDVFPALKNNKISLVLSHSDKDHIGGLINLLNSNVTVEDLWLPCYSNEIVKIANFLLSIKGVSAISSRSRSVLELNNVIDGYRFLDSIMRTKRCNNIRLVAKGDKICRHTSVLNPPLDPDLALGIEPGASEKYWKEQQNSNYETIRSWLTPEEFEKQWPYLISEGHIKSFSEFMNFTNFNPDFNSLGFDRRMRFIYGFFSKYESLIDDFVNSGDSRRFTKIVKELKLTSNDVSVVLKYKLSTKHDDFSCLLTGDVGKKQLANCVSDLKNEKIKIFKFPHHGSANSLDRNVLKKLSPEIVVVSHNNRTYGRQIDPHPSKKVIDALDKLNIPTAYTNDVIKNGTVVKNKSSTNPHKHVEMVEI